MLGDLSLKNRMVVAPLTRQRGEVDTGVPNDLMLEYYTQRVGFGLIITECSQISPLANGFPGSGGIYSQDQKKGWKKIVEKVHQKGGKIFLQIWHCGRQTKSEYIGGEIPYSSSNIPTSRFSQPREMTVQQIKEVIEEFRVGAQNAKDAGFDGVELHGANGYLVDQFLRDGSNKRTDEYGGSIENRSRFLFEVLDALISVYGSKRVAVRLSPTGRFGSMYDSNPLELIRYVLKQIEKRNLLFVEIKRHGSADKQSKKQTDGSNSEQISPDEQIPDFFRTIRSLYKGILIGNDGLTPETAEEGIRENVFDLVSFGTLSIANPDMPEKIKNGVQLNSPDPNTFYTGGQRGYIDYPLYKQN